MKKLLSLTVILSIYSTVFSQNRYYVSFNTGYAIGASKDAIGKSSQTFSNGDFKTANIYGTYGVGLPFSLRAGSKVNENLTAELGFSYLMGTNITTDKSTSPNTESTSKVKGNQIRVMPSLMFTGKNEALHLYGRIGLILPVGASSKSEQVTLGQDIGGNSSETIFKYDRTNAFNIGYFGALGVSVKIADNMHFFAEAELINLRMKQKTATLTEFTVNGEDKLETLTTQQKQTVYVDEVTSEDNVKINEPQTVRAQTQNFSSVGLNIGIKLYF